MTTELDPTKTMTTPTLDPDPSNQLGKGIFSPEREAELLAQGYIYAALLPKLKHLPFRVLVVCERLIADVATEMALDDPRVPNRRLPTPLPTE